MREELPLEVGRLLQCPRYRRVERIARRGNADIKAIDTRLWVHAHRHFAAIFAVTVLYRQREFIVPLGEDLAQRHTRRARQR